MPGVVDAAPLSGRAERLARVARREDIHEAAPRAALERDHVIPDRRLAQGLVFHPGHEGGRGVSVSFDVTNSSISGLGDVDTEFEPAAAGAEGNTPEGMWSHVIHAAPTRGICDVPRLDSTGVLPR